MIGTCLSCVAGSADAWTMPRDGMEDDEEGACVDPALPLVVDAHVHLFPDPLFEAIWRWFDVHGWPIRYELHTPQVIRFLLDRGVDHLVALQYAHKPGIARAMNAYMAEVVRAEPRVTGLAAVMPGEPDAKAILAEAFASGLRGVKLHCHVQCLPADDPAMMEVYEACVAHDMPVIVHAGREPKSAGYKCDPHAICHVDRVRTVLEAFPTLRLAIPHLGADEQAAYAALLDRHENLWLDTTMTLAGFFPGEESSFAVVRAHPGRILYGSDFPNIPYAWDRELRRIAARQLPEAHLRALLGGNARAFYRLPLE